MFVQDILNLARLRLDDVVADAKGKYLWSDDELLIYFNDSQRDFARRTRCLYDASTAAVCQYNVFPGIPTLTTDQRIVEINAAYLSLSNRPLFRRSVKYFDSHIALWGWQSQGWRQVQEMPIYFIPNYMPRILRFYPYYPLSYQGTTYGIQGASNVSFATNTITFAAGVVASMFTVGSNVVVSGSAHNDGVYVSAATPTGNTLTITVSTLTTENNTSAFVAKQIDTLNLEVARLPLVDVAIADTGTAVPEIDDDYHTKLVDGILSLAYLKRDSETYQIQEAMKYKERWEAAVEEAKTDQIISSEVDEAFSPAYGSI